jgi:DNA-binding CsgD family transcriptional regulator
MGVSERERNRCRERLGALAESDLEPGEARREAIAVLRRAVGFDRWCWPLTDPASALATGGIGEFDFWPSLPRLVALEEHGGVTSKPRLVLGRGPSVALSNATGGDLARSPRWRECLAPYGIGDELMTACGDRHGCWASVELMRDSDDPDFTEDDARLLGELAPVLARLLRRSARRGLHGERPERRPLPPATLILDAQLRAESWTPAVSAWLAEIQPDGAGPVALPAAVWEIGARVLTPPDAATGLPAWVRIRTRSAAWAVVEGAPLEGADRGSVAITMREASPGEVFDLLCRTYDLSRRERELAALMLDGLATSEVAESLYISPHTVQDHLKSIFDKTGVRSRRELRAHMAGASPPR